MNIKLSSNGLLSDLCIIVGGSMVVYDVSGGSMSWVGVFLGAFGMLATIGRLISDKK